MKCARDDNMIILDVKLLIITTCTNLPCIPVMQPNFLHHMANVVIGGLIYWPTTYSKEFYCLAVG